MTPRNAYLVQQSWVQIAEHGDAVVTEFYDRLFAANPNLRKLFPADMHNQKNKLLGALGFSIHSLGDPARLQRVLSDLGKRHVTYGVNASDYEAVGNALIETLESRMAVAFTPEMRMAWQQAYGMLSAMMQSR